MKNKFIVRKITAEEAKNNDMRNYNPQIWETNINRLVEGYKNVEFYLREKDDVYQYPRMYAEYTLHEGLRLWSEVQYGGSLTNGGFYRLDKFQVTADGRDTMDILKMFQEGDEERAKELLAEIHASEYYEVGYGAFQDPNGEKVLFGTSKAARNEMARRSLENNMTFTKG